MKKRKINKTATVATVAFMLTTAAVPVSAQENKTPFNSNSFQDVYMDNPYAEAITHLASLGILEADKQNFFRPENSVTYADAVEILERFIQKQGQIGFMYDRPTNAEDVTLEQAMGLLMAFIDTTVGYERVPLLEGDLRSKEAHDIYEEALKLFAYFQVDFTGKIAPQQELTRGEFAYFVHQVIVQIVQSDQVHGLGDFLLEDMQFVADGTQARGEGAVPGTTITVRTMYNDVIGTSFVNMNGTYEIALAPAVKDGQRIALELMDEANNQSMVEKYVRVEAADVDLNAEEEVVIDFMTKSNEAGPLVLSLEKVLTSASELSSSQETDMALADAQLTLANWSASNEQVIEQINEVLHYISVQGEPQVIKQMYQTVFTEFQQIALTLQQENFSQQTWAQVNSSVLQASPDDMQIERQLQLALEAFAGLSTRFEEEMYLIQDAFSDLQETIFAISDLFVTVSETGEDIPSTEQWTTLEEKNKLQQAVEKALDVYLKFEPTIAEVLQSQRMLDFAIIHYEESKQQGKKIAIETALQQQLNTLQLVAVSTNGQDITTAAQWTTKQQRRQLDALVATVKQALATGSQTSMQLEDLQQQLLTEVSAYNKAKKSGSVQTASALKEELTRLMNTGETILQTTKKAPNGQMIGFTQLWADPASYEQVEAIISRASEQLATGDLQKIERVSEELDALLGYVKQNWQRGMLSQLQVENAHGLAELTTFSRAIPSTNELNYTIETVRNALRNIVDVD